jgi:hypothetical protein
MQILPGDGELLRLGLQETARRPDFFSIKELVTVVWSAAVLRWPLPEGAAARLVHFVLHSPARADMQVLHCHCPFPSLFFWLIFCGGV